MKLRMLVVAAVCCLVIPVISYAQDTAAVKKAPMSNGTDCPMKCPTSKGAAGLTGVQFLALQQELRDRGCGNGHVTGWLDAPTRKAISVCAKRLGVANKAAAVLAAFDVGFAASDLGAGTGGGGMASEGSKAEESKESVKTEKAEKAEAKESAKTEKAEKAEASEGAKTEKAEKKAVAHKGMKMKGDTAKH
jgi:hypothetical protein